MKLAFITPRYGGDITAGPEHACRLLAEQVAKRHAVEVLTTCARDPRTWRNATQAGTDRVAGVVVRRFLVSHPHDAVTFGRLASRLQQQPPVREEELEWVRQHGPSSPDLLDYLTKHQQQYDALVFFSLVHPSTVEGVSIAPDRSVLMPYLQWQPALRFALLADTLSRPRALGLFSDVERTLLSNYVRAENLSLEVVGVGVDAPHQQTYPRHQQDPADEAEVDEDLHTDASDENGQSQDTFAGRGLPFRRRHRLYGNLALYGGRVEPDNGCEEMIDYFSAYTAAGHDANLVLLGVKMMRVPTDDGRVHLAGVLPDRERMTAYEAADVLVAPTPDDLLVLPVLESLAVGTPVLASTRSAAAVDHCVRSGGGLYYANGEEFVETLHLLMTDTRLRERLGDGGRSYVRRSFGWDAVLGRFDRLIGRVRAR